MNKLGELIEEFRAVFRGRKVLDSLLPPLLFLLLNAWVGLGWAAAGALLMAAAFALWRLARHQPPGYALGGLGGVALAILIALLLGRAEGYFLLGILGNGGTLLLALASVLLRRPLVAWTSLLARRWPRDWYWHPRVRPAYSEVTLAWALFFALRLALQLSLFQGQATLLGWVQVLTGWPATIVLLVASYLYGTWRLRTLKGPGVDEFKAGAAPPWSGQRRGF
jgi:hypothetical protein